MQPQQDLTNQVVDSKMISVGEETFFPQQYQQDARMMEIEAIAVERTKRTIVYHLIEILKESIKPVSTDFLSYEIASRQDLLIKPDGSKYKGSLDRTVVGALHSLRCFIRDDDGLWTVNIQEADESIRDIIQRFMEKEKKRKRLQPSTSLSRLMRDKEVTDSKMIEILHTCLTIEKEKGFEPTDPFPYITGTENDLQIIQLLGADKFEFLMQFMNFFSNYLFSPSNQKMGNSLMDETSERRHESINSVTNPSGPSPMDVSANQNVHSENTNGIHDNDPEHVVMTSQHLSEQAENEDQSMNGIPKRRKMDASEFSVENFMLEDPSLSESRYMTHQYWSSMKKDMSHKIPLSMSTPLLLDPLPSIYSLPHLNMMPPVTLQTMSSLSTPLSFSSMNTLQSNSSNSSNNNMNSNNLATITSNINTSINTTITSNMNNNINNTITTTINTSTIAGSLHSVPNVSLNTSLAQTNIQLNKVNLSGTQRNTISEQNSSVCTNSNGNTDSIHTGSLSEHSTNDTLSTTSEDSRNDVI
ncbi:hypothetical protein WA158_008043 [Blastocystis sp. Blastoise]